jgi:hypothetical protein
MKVLVSLETCETDGYLRLERRVVRRKRIKVVLHGVLKVIYLKHPSNGSLLLPKDPRQLLLKSLNGCYPGEDEKLTRAGDVGASDLPVLGANAVITRSKSGAGYA